MPHCATVVKRQKKDSRPPASSAEPAAFTRRYVLRYEISSGRRRPRSLAAPPAAAEPPVQRPKMAAQVGEQPTSVRGFEQRQYKVFHSKMLCEDRPRDLPCGSSGRHRRGRRRLLPVVAALAGPTANCRHAAVGAEVAWCQRRAGRSREHPRCRFDRAGPQMASISATRAAERKAKTEVTVDQVDVGA